MKRQTWIIITFILASLIFYAASIYIRKQVDTLLRSSISGQLGPQFEFDYRKSRINLFGNDFKILDLSIVKKLNSEVLWSFRVDQVRLSGFKPLELIGNKVLVADSISVKTPQVTINKLNLTARKGASTAPSDSANSLVFRIGAVNVRNASIVYDPEGPEYLTSGLEIDFKNIDFKGSILGMTRKLDNMEISLPNIEYTGADSVYTMRANELHISKLNQTVSIDSFSLRNNITVTQYSRFVKWRKSLFDIEIPEISMSLPKVFRDSIWYVPKISVVEPNVLIQKDNRFPLPDRHTELPQEQLKNLDLKFKIDTVQLNQTNIELRTVVTGVSQSDLFINDIEGHITSLQNYDVEQPAYKLYADGQLMKKAKLHAEITYLYGDVNPFSLSGYVQDVHLGFIDHYLRRQAGIAVISGELDGITFAMKGDHNGIAGEVDFRYHDLKIHMVDKDTDRDRVVLNLISDSAGNLFFYRDNPAKDELRKGKFYVERDVRKGFVSQWVEGLMTGILNTVLKVDAEKLKEKKHERSHKK